MSANTIITSTVTGGSNNHATVAEEANVLATDFVTQGVVGAVGLNVGAGGTGSFAVNADASPDMGITVKAGRAYVSATPSSQDAQVLRARATADYTAYTINANASGSTKYDWIYLKVDPTKANNPASDASDVTSIYTSRSTSNTVDNGTPPTYGLVLAVVTVANAASSITNSNILDKRVQATVTTSGTSAATGWTGLLTVPSTVTYNGNRSYSLVFNGTDLTGTVSNGMRLKTTRTVAAPTQCTSLNGTTQYYSKTSPAGMTSTTAMTAMGWVKPTAYQESVIVSRTVTAGTDGFRLYIDTNGTVVLNCGVDYNVSFQSVPLNKWTHVAVTMNLAGSPTGSIYIDGVLVPGTVSGAATSFTQNGNLNVGAKAGASGFFKGSLAQVAVFSAVLSQATIQSYISQGLAGTETSLISAYSFNNSINDLNANANNLTANGSAVATNADSPFGGQAGGAINSTLDYGIVQSATFSTNTTLVVQVPEGSAIPTSGGVSAVAYSTQKVPYGFPAQREKWNISMMNRTQNAQASPVNGTWYNIASQVLSIPIGEWFTRYSLVQQVTGSSADWAAVSTLSTANNSEIDTRYSSQTEGAAVTSIVGNATRSFGISLTVMTPYYLNTKTTASSATNLYNRGEASATIIEAECAYL